MLEVFDALLRASRCNGQKAHENFSERMESEKYEADYLDGFDGTPTQYRYTKLRRQLKTRFITDKIILAEIIFTVPIPLSRAKMLIMQKGGDSCLRNESLKRS